MGDFSVFYQNGGIFMHIITLGGAVGLTAALLHGRSRRMGVDNPKLMVLAERMAGICVALGLLGSIFGSFDLFAALAMVPREDLSLIQFLQVGCRGAGLVGIPLAWGLMCAIPLWIMTTVQRTRGVRRPVQSATV